MKSCVEPEAPSLLHTNSDVASEDVAFNVTIEPSQIEVEPVAEMDACAEELVKSEPRHGANPEVFCYQVANGRASVATIMLLRIYEGSRVTLLFRNTS